MNTSGPFGIIDEDDVFYTGAEELDYEGPTRTYISHLRGINPPSNSDDQTHIVDVAIVINVVDRNDQPPVFPSPTDTVQLQENSPNGDVVYTLSTTDADTDLNSQVRYQILQSNTPFTIIDDNVVVSDSDALDFDPPASVQEIELLIQAVNEALDDETQITNFTLTVQLTDENDNSPVCVGPSAFIYPEDLNVGADLRRAMAADIDSGLNQELRFSITRENTTDPDPMCSSELPFEIDQITGYIYACMRLDYENMTYYEFNITVCDLGTPQRCSQCPIMIQIMDVNDNAPVIIPPTEFSVTETSPQGTLVGCINADDADSGQNALLNYSLSAGVEECTTLIPFFVNDTTGCIEVCQPLNYEAVITYSFDIVVSDMGSVVLSTIATIIVDIINENDHPPVITPVTMADVIEELPNALVLTVLASDADAPPFNNFTFSLVDSAGGRFTIDPFSGVVLTTQSLDREEQAMYSITVRVTDGVFSANQTITVYLTDINDNFPQYVGQELFSFLEESLFQLVVPFTDRDVGQNANLTYTVSDARFSINNFGVLMNLVLLNREEEAAVTLEITARDWGVPFRENQTIITIVLLDINDNAPQALPPFMADVIDGSPEGTAIITLNAVDADEGSNSALLFTLIDDAGTFKVDNETGVVTLTRDINLVSSTVVTIPFTASISDRGLPTQTITQNYTIFIVSSVPGFPQTQYSFSILENSFGESMGVIRAMDRDLNLLNDAFEYTILSVSPYNAGFTVDSSEGNATITSPSSYLDYEDNDVFTVILGVSRPNMTAVVDDTTTVVITVLGLNDNTPRLSPLNITAELAEHSADGTIVAMAIAIDFDLGPSGQLTFNHTGNGQNYFEFDASGYFIVSNSNLIDFESDTSFTFLYQACDNGVPQVCSAAGYIFITVVNIDDLPPVFNPNVYNLEISEGFGFNRLLTYINFTDPDTPLEDITLSLDPPQTQFTILLLSGTGALMTTDEPLDRETIPIHTFNIIATDTAAAQATAMVTIILLDENDERPRVEPMDNVVYFLEGVGTATPAAALSIVDRDDVSLYPLRSVQMSLHPSPMSIESFPLPGGQCNHDNYTILYDNNVHSLCSEGGCTYLLDPAQISGGVIVDRILDLGQSPFARNFLVLFSGEQLLQFSVTIWVRFSAPSNGFIVEMQSTVNIFSLQVLNDGSLNIQVNPTGNNPTRLVETGQLPTHDGEWHQVAVVRQMNVMSIYFDSEMVASASNVDNSTVDSPFTRGEFESGTFFLGNRLDNALLSEFYFCDSVITNEHLFCTFTCGETLDVTSSTENVTATINHRTRTVELTYTGTDTLASLPQLEVAMRTVNYSNILDEPHPLDRGVFLLVTDMVGPSDTETVVTVRPILINDQRPVLDLNGFETPGLNFATVFDETSLGTEVIGANAILYDRDSGYWPLDRIIIQLISAGSLEALVNSGSSELVNVTLLSGLQLIALTPRISSTPVFPEAYLSALRNILYLDLEEEPVEFDRVIQFTVFDEGSNVNDPLSFTTVTVTPTNDKPTLDLDSTNPNSRDTTATYLEESGSSNIIDSSRVAIADEDSTMFSSAIFTFVTRPDMEAESLALFPPATTVTASFDIAAGVLTLVGALEANEWVNIFGNVMYQNANGGLSDVAVREVSVVITDIEGATSDPALVRITVRPFNDPPTIFLGGPGIKDYVTTFTEDGNCVPIVAPDSQILDPDTNSLQNVRVVLNTNGIVSDSEYLEVTANIPQIRSFSFMQRTSIIFIQDQSSSIEFFEIGLRSVVYCNNVDEPDESFNRTITVTALDTTLTTEGGVTRTGSISSLSTSSVQIVRVNDRPELFFEPQQNVSVRGVPTIIINPDNIEVEDSDDDVFSELIISIINPQDGDDQEIIQFDMDLPFETVSIGPLPGANNSIEYSVTFQNNGGRNERVYLTIGRIRYNNIATDITVDPPRVICVQISDFKIFSEQTCVTVTISPANNFNPVFDPASMLEFTRNETNLPLTLTTLQATDADPGLEGDISYRISQVLSVAMGIPPVTRVTTGLFEIDSEFGVLTVPNGLDADDFQLHNVTVIAEDMGNPVLTDTVYVVVRVEDLNDIAPVFVTLSGDEPPYDAPPQREELDPPRSIFIVRAEDRDFTSPNNRVVRYELLNFQDRFSIDNNGIIQFITQLDAEEQSTYALNISAVDGGSPPQTSYATVLFSLTDFNDNPAEIQQLAPAVIVIGGAATSIGPALRINDPDLGSAAISSIEVTLVPNAVDSQRQYIDCLMVCQEARLQDAGLLSSTINLLDAATFQSDNNAQGAFNDSDVIGGGNCPAVTVNRLTTLADDGYGRIPRASLPTDFGSGEFSISFVLRQDAEGFVLTLPDSANPTLPASAVERQFAVWVRRFDIRVYYVYGAGSFDTAVYRQPTGQENFTPGSGVGARHYTLVLRTTSSTTAEIDYYIDCALVDTQALLGVPVSPSSNIDLFIGNSRPPATISGRLGGALHGLYYHNSPLTQTQVLDFCSCGQESLVLPLLPNSIRVSQLTNQRVVFVANSSDLIPQADAESVLRDIGYLNTFIDPTVDPPRSLQFSLTEETGDSANTIGNVYLVTSDNALPVLDISFAAGINYVTTFTEDAGPVAVAPDSRMTRLIDGFLNPTFDRVIVQLTNAQDTSETLSAVSTESYITVQRSPDRQMVEIIGPGIAGDFITVLDTLVYENTDDRPTTTNPRVIQFTIVDTDGRQNNPLAQTSVNLITVNDPPEISLSSNSGDLLSSAMYDESTPGVAIAPALMVQDVDSDNLVSATLNLTTPTVGTDTLTATVANPNIFVSFSGNILSLSGSASLEEYRQVLASVNFSSTDSPFLDNSGQPEEDPTRTVVITVSDGQLDSEMAQVTIEFIPRDDPPVVSIGNATIIFNDGDGAVLIAPNAIIADDDNRILASMLIELSRENDAENDVLRSGANLGPVLEFEIPDTIANFESNLRGIEYVNFASEPELSPRTITITVRDFMGSSTTTVTINIVDVNDNPPNFTPSLYNFDIPEDATIGTTIGVMMVSDADRNMDVITLSIAPSSVPFIVTLVDNEVGVSISQALDAEDTSIYSFTVTASDGVNNSSATVTVDVLNVNEPPSITLDPSNPSVVLRPLSVTQLLQNTPTIFDPDINDEVKVAILTLRDVPSGSNESLNWNPIPGYSFGETATNVYRLESIASNVSLEDALLSLTYVVGSVVTSLTEIRTVGVLVIDAGDLSSNEVTVAVSLASVPVFTQMVYNVSLLEGMLAMNFLTVQASVESGGDVIEYAVEQGFGVMINAMTGDLSLLSLLDREVSPTMSFEVYAIDALPPARTGTAMVTITVMDSNDVQPIINGLDNLTVFSGISIALFPNATITDPDTVALIMRATITLMGDPLPSGSFTGRVCVDEYNTIAKMTSVCGLPAQSFIDLVSGVSATGLSLVQTRQPGSNDVLMTNGGYAIVTENFTDFTGQIDEFTLAFWIQVSSSGYIVYYGNTDFTERYLAVYYSAGNNQLILTLKRQGESGLSAQIRVSFQLSTVLSDGGYHFMMLQYGSRNVVCAVDAQLVTSTAVVYKESPFIGEVFGEYNVYC